MDTGQENITQNLSKLVATLGVEGIKHLEQSASAGSKWKLYRKKILQSVRLTKPYSFHPPSQFSLSQQNLLKTWKDDVKPQRKQTTEAMSMLMLALLRIQQK